VPKAVIADEDGMNPPCSHELAGRANCYRA
jgi:hypothetical protein